MQVAADPLAFGAGGQPAHFFLRQLQRCIAALADAVHLHHHAHDQGHQRHPHHRLPRIAEQHREGHERATQQQHLSHHRPSRPTPVGMKEHAAEDEVGHARGIPGQQHQTQGDHRRRVAPGRLCRRQQHPQVERDEQRIRHRGQQPPAPAVAAGRKGRGDEYPCRPQQVHQLDPGRPPPPDRIGGDRVRRWWQPALQQAVEGHGSAQLDMIKDELEGSPRLAGGESKAAQL